MFWAALFRDHMQVDLMKRVFLAIVTVIAMPAALAAQELGITPQMPVNSEILHQWLHSGDPQRIAWAADFAQKTHDTKTLSEMPALLEHWAIPQGQNLDQSQSDQRTAATAVLDALIQQNVETPLPVIRAIADQFPDQAAILISRIPLKESNDTLNVWTYEATGTWGVRMLARVATMMLAKQGAPGTGPASPSFRQLVLSVVSASEEELRATIRSSEGVGSGYGTGACGDSFGSPPRVGWPIVFSYGLVENEDRPAAPVVVELDGDRIQFERVATNSGWGTCSYVGRLDPVTRHKLLAYWLGVKPVDMKWQPIVDKTIVWTDEAAYERQLGAIVAAERAKLHATAMALRDRNLLTDDDLRIATPRLVVNIRCEIDPCPVPRSAKTRD
jgi:hypothetical protein